MPSWRAAAALAATILCLACAAPEEPAPWMPTEAAPQPYRGMPDGLLMSADGERIAVFYRRGYRDLGVAVVDARSGAILLTRDFLGGRSTSFALSPRGDRLLSVAQAGVVETEVASGRDTVVGLGSHPLSLVDPRFVGYDPQNEDRIVLLLPGTSNPSDFTMLIDRGRVVHLDRRRPGVIDRMFTLDAPDNRELIARAVSPGGGIVGMLAVRSSTQVPPGLVMLRPPPLPDSALGRPPTDVEMLRLTADGQRMLVFGSTPHQGGVTHHALLLDAGGSGTYEPPADARRLTRPEGGFIREGAISADGRRAAMIIEPVTGSDPQPVLWIADLDATEPEARAVRTLADLGVGRTPEPTTIRSEELLRSLRAIAEGGMPRAGAIDEAAIRRAGMRLGFAGPCLTVPDAIRVLGEPEPDRRSLLMPSQYNPLSARMRPPESQPRYGVTVRYGSGLEISLAFERQHCAQFVRVQTTQPAR